MARLNENLMPIAVALALASSPPALAEEALVTPVERVEVVGSRIPRANGEGAAPVTVIDRARIERMGASRISDVLLQLPYFSPGGFDNRIASPELTQGSAAVSLRGLGPSATLVLLNGRRIAPYGVALEDGGAFVDLNSLPLAAVDRIEILRDGASAIYGADALAGVVNIVLRRDFRGAESAVSAGASGHADAKRWQASAAAGTGGLEVDGYNVFAVVEVFKETHLASLDRAFSRSADQRPNGGSDNRSRDSFPPTIRIAGQAFAPGPGCPADRIRPLPDQAGAECVFDVAPYASLLPDVQRADLLLVGNYQWRQRLLLFAEASVGRTRTTRRFSPVPAFSELPAGLATNPYGLPVGIFFRALDAGPRQLEATADSDRLVAGATYAPGNWEWELAAGINRIGADLRLANTLSRSRLNAALSSGAFDPFAPAGNPALIGALKVDIVDRFTSQLGFVNVKSNGEAARLEHGPLRIAFGIETRRERFSTRLDPLSLAGDLSGNATIATEDGSGSRRVNAAFAEASWPIATGVEAQVAGRFDHYFIFGAELSPKAAVRWQLASQWLARLSAGRGFLPPALFQIHQPPYAQEEQVRDPARCPVTRRPSDCVRIVPYSLTGNRALQPERSRQFNAGLAWVPSETTSATIDFWRIDHRDKIALAEDHLLESEAAFPGRVVRGVPEPSEALLGLPGPILALHDTFINLARQKTRGIDVEARWKGSASIHGQLAMGVQASLQQSFRSRLTAESPTVELTGADGRPRWRASLTASWERGPWEAGLAAHYLGTYRFVDGVAGVTRRAASWTTLDAHAAWNFSKSGRLAVVVRNALDRDPPFRPDRISGYDTRVHDPVGRFFLATLRWTF